MTLTPDLSLQIMRLHRDHIRSQNVAPSPDPFWWGLGFDYNTEYISMEGDDTEFFRKVERMMTNRERVWKALIAKHRPGGHDHDQSTHGRRSSSTDSGLRRWVKMMARAEMGMPDAEAFQTELRMMHSPPPWKMNVALAEHGEFWKGPSPERHAELIEEYGVEVGEAKRCFPNAFHVAMDTGLTYVEGVAVTDLGIPVHHAWVVTPDGEVIDPTWHSQTTRGTDLRLDPGLEYIGIPVDYQYLLLRAVDTGVYGIWQGEGDPPDIEEMRA